MSHEQVLARAVEQLRRSHPEIEQIVSLYGPPPLWGREPGFASLVYTILEQQVSLASARAVYRRLKELVGELTPESFAEIHDSELRRIGFSRQKTAYCRNIASLIIEGNLDLEAVGQAADQEARRILMDVKGIGRWTSDIYLLHSLKRPDIWPAGDLALQIGYQEAAGLTVRPDEKDLEKIGSKYTPFRSAAARVIWHYYISKRNLKLA